MDAFSFDDGALHYFEALHWRATLCSEYLFGILNLPGCPAFQRHSGWRSAFHCTIELQQAKMK